MCLGFLASQPRGMFVAEDMLFCGRAVVVFGEGVARTNERQIILPEERDTASLLGVDPKVNLKGEHVQPVVGIFEMGAKGFVTR